MRQLYGRCAIKSCAWSVPWKLVDQFHFYMYTRNHVNKEWMWDDRMCVSRVVVATGDRYTRSGPGGRVAAPQRYAVPARSLLFNRNSAVIHAARAYRTAAAATVPWVQWLPPDCCPLLSNGTVTWMAGGKWNYCDQPYMKPCTWTSVENGDRNSSSLD